MNIPPALTRDRVLHMGQQSKARSARKAHRDMFGGMTAQEVTVQALGKKCTSGCGLDAIGTIRISAPLVEMINKFPEKVQKLAIMNDGSLPVFEVMDGTRRVKHVRIGIAHFCQVCRSNAEKEAARCPSWAYVVIDAGAEADKPIVQVK